VAAQPDAVIVVAVGGGAALPQKALKERGYQGKIYHTAASVSPDFLRLAGPDAAGALVSSGPEQVAEQLPDSHPGKQNALAFVKAYEDKYGPGSRTQFAAHIYDFSLILQKIIPVALKKAKPGTPEFRAALRDALENYGPITTTKGVLKYTPEDHWGFGPDARVILTPKGNDWKLVD
jgi:branched-chain amino acid transport system substrate-binding protein